MKKGVSSGIETIAKIILIVLVLFIIISALNGLYGQTFKDGIKKLFGEKTEAEVTHEQNEMVKEAFESLEKQIKKCQDFKSNNCGCLVNLNQFGNNYKITLTDQETKLINIKNQVGSEIQMTSFDAKSPKTNCYWGNNFKDIELKNIFFKDRPFIFERVFIWSSITGNGNRYYFTSKFNILKKDRKLCWLTNKVDEDKIKSLSECQ